mmetsp:Transcript_62655/g.154020  ORF Transcript_62655/g.154020 Transcript_62655/m.154020 type:complete len:310 (-) Transcript_62655:360-1289(-)
MPSFIVTLAKWTQPNACKIAAQTGVPQMISIKYSHYCEFARFCLLLSNTKVQEALVFPGQHILPVLALRLGGGGGKPAISNSAAFQKVTDGPISERKAKAARATATPVIALPDGSFLTDSWAIAEYSGLPPLTDEGLKKVLDEEIGVDARHLAYYHFLQKDTKQYLGELCLQGAPFFWKIMWYLGVGNYILNFFTKAFQPERPDLADSCRERLKKSFATVAKALEAKKGAFLGGDKPGVADIAIAALAAPLVLPDENYGGMYHKIWTKIVSKSPGFRADQEFFRNTPVGKHTLKVYKEYRPTEPGFKKV